MIEVVAGPAAGAIRQNGSRSPGPWVGDAEYCSVAADLVPSPCTPNQEAVFHYGFFVPSLGPSATGRRLRGRAPGNLPQRRPGSRRCPDEEQSLRASRANGPGRDYGAMDQLRLG